ncbi:MAG: hypothetical protein H7Y61_15935, partial [Rhizobiales bacterium]|nr:hypothetical protein [Rhizobacter sp.]
MLSALRVGFKVFVVAVAAAVMVLTLAQLSGDEAEWVELTRYLPYYWLLLPCVAAVVLAIWLGRRWVLASLIAPALLATATMGLELNAGEPGEQRVRLMTFNAKLHGGNDTPANVSAVAREVARHAPDILVMQDADGLLVHRSAPALVGGPPLFGLPHVYALSQYVVASRLPLRGCAPGNIDFGSESHRYLRCSFDAHGTELTVVTAHFKSPRVGLVAARREGVDGVNEWRQNVDDRMTQSRSLARQL